ncbi:MAG: hypothetical protein KGH71_00560 [Candidatus Micrarchaeota archaeon]|nr:hypothetical protein [Candidatus Micrarchaeota archaeon]
MANLRNLLFISFVGISLVLMIVTVSLSIPNYLKIIFLIVALFIDILAASTRYYTYLFVPFTKIKDKTIVLSNEEPFYLAPSGTALIVRDGNEVYATAFIKIPIYKSATEMNEEEKIEFARLFSRIVSLSRTPLRISSQMYLINKDDYITKIRDRLNLVEENYQKASVDKSTDAGAIERLKGEVTMWHNLLESIGRVQSHALINYASVTALGTTEEEATSLVTQQAEEIAAGIGAILGINAPLMTGEEILLVTQPDFTIPFSTVSESIRQKTVEEGL